jgi:hypothetical protein
MEGKVAPSEEQAAETAQSGDFRLPHTFPSARKLRSLEQLPKYWRRENQKSPRKFLAIPHTFSVKLEIAKGRYSFGVK